MRVVVLQANTLDSSLRYAAFGMTDVEIIQRPVKARVQDDEVWIPAFAGLTVGLLSFGSCMALFPFG